MFNKLDKVIVLVIQFGNQNGNNRYTQITCQATGISAFALQFF